MTDEEYERLESLHSPMFDLWLRFRSAFARLAIEKYNLSDGDAEACAALMEETEAGRAYGYLLRNVQDDRMARMMFAKVEAVWAYEGKARGMNLSDVVTEFAKLPKGES